MLLNITSLGVHVEALFGNLYVIIPLTPSKILWGVLSLLVVDHAPLTTIQDYG